MNQFGKDQIRATGLKHVLDQIELASPYGRQQLSQIRPYQLNEKKLLEQEFDQMSELYDSMNKSAEKYKGVKLIIARLKDIRESVSRCERGVVLDEVELFEIKYFALKVEELRRLYEELALELSGIDFESVNDIVELLDPDGQRLATFHLYDAYSEDLKEVRMQKRLVERMIKDAADPETSKSLEEERISLIIIEEDEAQIVMENLSKSIKKHIQVLKNNMERIGRFEFLIGKVTLAQNLKGIRPKLDEKGYFSIQGAFNPMVVSALSEKGELFTPVSIVLKPGATVVTGANMGGKSIALKTISLNVMLVLLGFFPFAEEMIMPIFGFVYMVSDDMQSVAKGLSTFGAEIIKLKEIIANASVSNGFIAIDELARGTNPREGTYLLKSILSYLNKKESISLLTTHYDGVISEECDHYQVVGLKEVDFNILKKKIDLNESKTVEIIQTHMDYRLEKVKNGTDVPKDALNICSLLGLESAIVNEAKQLYEEGE